MPKYRFSAWRDNGTFEKINHALLMANRERVGRETSPSAAIIDSQSVKTTEAGGPRGFDAGKKINGRKRHALVDTAGTVATFFRLATIRLMLRRLISPTSWS